MILASRRTHLLLCLLLAAVLASAQDFDLEHLVTRGQVTVDGQIHAYIVRHLPPSSFPDLPFDFVLGAE